MSGRERLRPTAPDPGDLGHLIPADDWQRVVEEAERERERIARGEPAPELPEQRGRATGLLAVSGVVVARSHGGSRAAPTFGVLHSAETPLRAGYAASIARYFRDQAPTSCHYMTDPAETWGVLDDLVTAWHCGNGNTNSIGLEQAGRAAMSRAEWLVPDGMAQLRRNAAIIRAARARFGIGAYWMSDQQIRDAHARRIVGGWCTHDDARRVLFGTTHTDPGRGFPRDVQMQLANDGSTPPPSPAPVPAPTNGAERMDLVKVAGTPGPIYLVTDLELYGTHDIRLVDAVARGRRTPLTDLNAQQVDLLRADVDRRRRALGLPVKLTAGGVVEVLPADSPEPGSDEYLDQLDEVLEFSRLLLPAPATP